MEAGGRSVGDGQRRRGARWRGVGGQAALRSGRAAVLVIGTDQQLDCPTEGCSGGQRGGCGGGARATELESRMDAQITAAVLAAEGLGVVGVERADGGDPRDARRCLGFFLSYQLAGMIFDSGPTTFYPKNRIRRGP